MNDLYVALVDYGQFEGSEFVTSLDPSEFYKEIMEKLLDKYGDDYPDLEELLPSNTEAYISDYSDEDYQDIITKILNHLHGEIPCPSVSYLKILPNINKDIIQSIDTDII